MIDHTSSIHIL